MIRGRKRSSGFTLVELMIVVAIIGILAAIAIPAFSRYIKRSRTAEAVGHLNKMWAGSVTYYESDHSSAAGAILAKQFPYTTATTIEADCCGLTGQKCPGGSITWDELSYAISDAHMYRPWYQSAGTAQAATFTARAIGNLDCDATFSTFTRLGSINAASGDVTSNGAVNVTNELE